MSKTRNKLYRGLRVQAAGGCVVTVDGVELDPRFDLRNHSPDGFQWGYGGSGPAQLALALCASALDDDDRALGIYQYFKGRIITRLNFHYWVMPAQLVVTLVTVLDAERYAAQKLREEWIGS